MHFICNGQGSIDDFKAVERYPVFFDQYYNSISFVNPSSVGKDENYEISAGNQRLVGYESNVSTSFFNFNKRLIRSYHTKHPYSALGILVYNDSEGRYINRGRIYMQYAWHARLGRNYFFSGGFKVGGANYTVKLPQYSEGNGSAYKADGGMGFSFYSQNSYLGLCVSQIFKSRLQPFLQIVELSPYATLNFNRTIRVNSLFNIKPMGLAQITFSGVENLYSGLLSLEYNNKISITSGYRSRYGMVYMLNIQNINYENASFSVGVSYVIPLSFDIQGINIVEFNLNCNIKKFRK